MKVVTLDIETTPHDVWAWGIWNQNIPIGAIKEPGHVMCFAAKWDDSKQIEFYSDHQEGGHERVVKEAWRILDEADAVVHWNGRKFDIPHLQGEFIRAGLTPPRPFRQIDLLLTARRVANFPSNKLDYWAQVLLGDHKTHHEGLDLWLKCMSGDDAAWRKMERYNRQDVRLTARLRKVLTPWLTSSPHASLYRNDTGEADVCGKCGSDKLVRRGYAYTDLGKYQQLRCSDCGAWSRGKRAVATVTVRPEVQR